MCVLLFAAAADDKDEVAKAAKDLKSKDVKVRLKAVEKLADLGDDASRPLCDAMLDSSPKVAQAALVALEKANPKLYKPVSALVLDAERSSRSFALKEIGKFREDGRPAINLLIARCKAELAQERSFARFATTDAPTYIETTIKIGGDCDECIRFMKALTADPHPWANQEALQKLVAWAGDDEKRKKELLPVIKAQIQDDANAVPFIKAAGDYGALSKDMLPSLKKLKLSKITAVREAATGAVESIEKP